MIATDADYIILATPPGFRPEHLKAAVAAGKNIFTEKPVAVDGPGIRSVLETYEAGQGEEPGHRGRHAAPARQRLRRDDEAHPRRGHRRASLSARCYWNQGALWNKPRQAEWTDLEWQMRNWLYFTWLSGDHIVEQHVHNLDVVNWAMNAHPVKALGLGGRQVRTGPECGHIFDHFTIDYEYPSGVHVLSMCRQIPGTRRPRGRRPVGHARHLRDVAGRQALRDHGQERLALDPEQVGVRPLRAGAHRPDREHPRRASRSTS